LGKIIIIITMYLGRIGPITLFLALMRGVTKPYMNIRPFHRDRITERNHEQEIRRDRAGFWTKPRHHTGIARGGSDRYRFEYGTGRRDQRPRYVRGSDGLHEQKALKAQDITDVDAAVVCIGENFQDNLLTTVLLKKMGVQHVITRASNPIERQILSELGADELIYPEEDLARELSVRLMADSILDMFPLSPSLGAARLKAPKSFWNRKLIDLNLRQEYGINIIAIYDAELMEKTDDPFPHSTDVIKEGDVLLIVGRRESIERLANYA
jgi:trk system potassium uptake protein TrkA